MSEALGRRQIQPGDLPRCLAVHGLAPELGNDIGHAYWPTGGEGPRHDEHGADAAAQHIPEHAAAEANISAARARTWTMRQLLAHIAGQSPTSFLGRSSP